MQIIEFLIAKNVHSHFHAVYDNETTSKTLLCHQSRRIHSNKNMCIRIGKAKTED